ncbi:MAG: VTT domain-containing protein [Bacteriovoracaceae bacterium]
MLLYSLLTAGIIGDAVNYSIGRYLGSKDFKSQSRFLKEEYLDKTQAYYDRNGGKTIILARYVPIIRTFAPYYWCAFLGPHFAFPGQFFGDLPQVKSNFHIVIFGIFGVSILPMAIELVTNYRQ